MNQNRSIADLGTQNPEPRTQNRSITDPRTQNPELRTQNPELRFESQIFEPRTEPTTNFHASSWTLNAADVEEAQ